MFPDRDLDELLSALERRGPSAGAVDHLESQLEKQVVARLARADDATPAPAPPLDPL